MTDSQRQSCEHWNIEKVYEHYTREEHQVVMLCDDCGSELEAVIDWDSQDAWVTEDPYDG